MAAVTDGPMPWEYWRVRFAERGICRWDEFEDMNLHDIMAAISVWDGLARAEIEEARKHGRAR